MKTGRQHILIAIVACGMGWFGPMVHSVSTEPPADVPTDSTDSAAPATDATVLEASKTRWHIAIANHVASRWFRPPKLPSDLKCTVEIRLAPTGKLEDVRIVEPSGNDQFDRSVENAIFKADPFPLPDRPDAFTDTLPLTFTPERYSGDGAA
jgi:colicin import membrane protein